MNARDETATERALHDALAATLASVAWISLVRAAPGPDASLDLRVPRGRKVRLLVKTRAELRPGLFPAWAASNGPSGASPAATPVLLALTVSPRLADLCRQAGWSWHDLAGNCWIDVPGVLHIERSGVPPARRPPRPAANLGTAAAARVLRALLSPAHAGRVWTQRSLQTETCWRAGREEGDPVSLGLVNKVVRHLRDEGFVEDASAGARGRGVRVRDPRALLDAWKTVYHLDRHERRSFFSLRKGTDLQQALHRVGLEAGGMAVYAAFSAAERQAPHVRQPKTWLYVAARHIEALIKNVDAKEVDSGENIVVMVPDDPGVFVSFDSDAMVGEKLLGCTDPVQTYVDLVHCGGRGEEAARALLEQRLLPAWKAAGRP